MRVKHDCIWLCQDCTIAAVNDDYTGMNDAQEQATRDGLSGWPYLIANFDPETGEGIREFSSRICEVCGTSLAGYRARFAQLEDDSEPHIKDTEAREFVAQENQESSRSTPPAAPVAPAGTITTGNTPSWHGIGTTGGVSC